VQCTCRVIGRGQEQGFRTSSVFGGLMISFKFNERKGGFDGNAVKKQW
jgi:hypothetical protein